MSIIVLPTNTTLNSEASTLKMATFSYFQHYPHSLLDPLLYSTPNSSAFIDQDTLHSLPKTSTIEDTSLSQFLNIDNKSETFALKNQSNRTTGSSSDNQLSQGPATPSTGNKRRKKGRNVANSMEGVEGRKSKKQRNSGPSDVKVKRGSDEKPLKDYIHVRARRGQATDSHSLAERVRREKISEKMKTLQNLVPNCDKVTGKALMLDEIINYVQSLQNQVEYLSMKLASISPVVYDFGSDLEDLILRPEMESPDIGMSFTNTMPTTTPFYPSQIQEDGNQFEDKSGFNNFCCFT